ncbi:MAG: GNAT family N-acetyltransferase, partial [Fimbriimonadales bacterium]|nr:GNAT family N-acetyltransferase [Fimbriimonadales bacterium]
SMLWRRAETEARRITPDESEWFLRVLCAGFGLDIGSARRFFYDDPYFEVNQRWGLWLNERGSWTLVSILTAIPLTMWIGARAVPFYGIAGVATLPDYRRRGFAGELLRRALQSLYHEGAPLAILQAFNHEFYRKLGWETVGAIAHVRLTPKQLPRYSAEPLRRAGVADHAAVMRLHEQHGVRRTGSLVRDERRWEYLFWNLPNLWVYEHQGQMEGYLFYDFLDSGWTLRVREMLWCSERARRAILGWLADNEESVQQVEFQLPLAEVSALGLMGWSAPPTEPSQPFYTAQMLPNFMARPVHTAALLRALLSSAPAPEGFQPFNLRVRDSVLKANGEVVGVRVENGRLDIGGELSGAPSLSLAPTSMAMLALGTMSAPELCARRILNAPETLLPTLDALFPERQPCLAPIDFF